MEIVRIIAQVFTVTVATFSLYRFYKMTKDRGRLEDLTQVKEHAYQLFLYAEKQNWIGKEKMNWVVQEMFNRVPSNKLLNVIGKERVIEWLQSLYDEFKHSLSNINNNKTGGILSEQNRIN